MEIETFVAAHNGMSTENPNFAHEAKEGPRFQAVTLGPPGMCVKGSQLYSDVRSPLRVISSLLRVMSAWYLAGDMASQNEDHIGRGPCRRNGLDLGMGVDLVYMTPSKPCPQK